MHFTIQRFGWTLTVSSLGAELWDLHPSSHPELPLLWDGKETVWPWRAPICFPWCGKIDDNWFTWKGDRYRGQNHGFVRELEHTLIDQGPDYLTFRLDWAADSTQWPWSFSLETCHRLVPEGVLTTCTGVNRSGEPMPAQLGFHTGLRCPFYPGEELRRYAFRFEQPESPEGGHLLELTPHLFSQGSLRFSHPASKWIQLERKGGGYLRIGTEGYAYVLLWSKDNIIPGFVCIEPWSGFRASGHDLLQRPGTVMLAPGEAIQRTQRLTVCGLDSPLIR